MAIAPCAVLDILSKLILLDQDSLLLGDIQVVGQCPHVTTETVNTCEPDYTCTDEMAFRHFYDRGFSDERHGCSTAKKGNPHGRHSDRVNDGTGMRLGANGRYRH